MLVQKLVERFGSGMFKCGESDSGRKLKVTLRDYIEYALYNRDDSPLYMFEPCLEEHPQAKDMLNDYKPAKLFEEDLFPQLVKLLLEVTLFVDGR
jgi:histone arginine demethylase JMJD6